MRLDHFDDSSLGVGPRVQRSSEQGADKLVGLAYPFKVDLFLTSRFDPQRERSQAKVTTSCDDAILGITRGCEIRSLF